MALPGDVVAETKIALVPLVVVTGLTQRRYGLVLTDARAIFVLQRSLSLPVFYASSGVGGAAGTILATLANMGSTTTVFALSIGAFFGMALAWSGMRESIPNYATLTPDQLAGRKGALAIPYASIQALVVDKGRRFSSRLLMTYLDSAGMRREFYGVLLPETRWLQSRVRAGVKGREAVSEYVESVRQALRRALPPELVSKVRFA